VAIRSAVAEHLIEGKFWVSPDRLEVVLSFPGQKETYYFNNDYRRLCYSYAAPGSWEPTGRRAILRYSDTRYELSVILYAEEQFEGMTGSNLEERAANFIADKYREALGKALASSKISSFASAVPGSIKWTATWHEQRGGKPYEFAATKYFAVIEHGWVAALTIVFVPDKAIDDLARKIFKSLNTKHDAECYWPFLREHVPNLR